MGRDEVVSVEVVYCAGPGHVDSTPLSLPAGTTLRQALLASGVLQRNGLGPTQVAAGVWGRVQPLDSALRDRDRIELYRPLTVDPKEARRLRYRRHQAVNGEANQEVKKAKEPAPRR